MRYLSLFSGIGGFEVAIHRVFKSNAECVGYSEIDKHAIREYMNHYPQHKNMGDVKNINKRLIDSLGHIDLIVGGFPCNDLSSASHQHRTGLEGLKSGLFWDMLRIIKWVKRNNPDLQIIIENNASMSNRWRDMITSELGKIFKTGVVCNYFDSSQWVMQRRRRYYWTLKEIPKYTGKKTETMEDVLVSKSDAMKHVLSDHAIAYFNKSPTHLKKNSQGVRIVRVSKSCYMLEAVPFATRLYTYGSSSNSDYIRCIDTRSDTSFILDYRLCKRKDLFVPRVLTKEEMNRLFGYPENYLKTTYKTVYTRLYGMTVVPPVIEYILTKLV